MKEVQIVLIHSWGLQQALRSFSFVNNCNIFNICSTALFFQAFSFASEWKWRWRTGIAYCDSLNLFQWISGRCIALSFSGTMHKLISPHNSPLKWIKILCQFYRWGFWGREKLSDFSMGIPCSLSAMNRLVLETRCFSRLFTLHLWVPHGSPSNTEETAGFCLES